MGVEPWVAVALLAVLVVALVREVASTAAVMVGGLVAFVLVGLLPPDRAFVGFSSPATITIAGLFVIARAVAADGGLTRGVDRLLGDGAAGVRRALVRLVPAVTGVSGVVNNTPVVATMAPMVRDWARRHGLAGSQLLIPLSFAAILGGVLTTIGTGPNLVVSGVLQAAGEQPLAMLSITPVGLPVAVIGMVLLIVLAPVLLPVRRSVHERLASQPREYTVRLRVRPDGDAVGRTIAQAGLRDLATTYLAGVVRDDEELAPVSPSLRLHADDVLIFVGGVGDIRDLLINPGLIEDEQPQTRLLDGAGHRLVECVVGPSSPLVGTTLKRVSFRGRYGGAVVAIHRAGTRLSGKLGQVTLHAGDALLVLADDGFADRWQAGPDFAVVVALDAPPPVERPDRRLLTTVTVAGMVGVAASGLVPIVVAVLAACTVLVATRTISFRDALDALDREVLLIVACAIGLGVGLETSGAAGVLAQGIAAVAGATGPAAALAVLVIGTVVLTELITNVAAAALMAQIAIDTAALTGADPTGYAIAVAVAASASFLTPVGYQTNTIVFALGNYRFTDYWKLGLPLAIGTVTVILTVVPRWWG